MEQFNNHAIDKFVKQVQTAKDYNSKELRLTISEADALSHAITLLMTRDLTLSQKVMDLQDKLISQMSLTPRNLDLNGGGF